jgi:SAM-dependent methyltransferase
MPSHEYDAVENLEVLEEAENYNGYLASLAGQAGNGMRSAIDFGSGRGTIASLLRQRGFEVVCVEPDPGLRGEIAARGFAAFEDLSRVEPADLILCANVLEHIEDDLRTLRQLRSKLRPGGRLVLYVPAFNVLYSAMDRFVGHYRRYRLTPLVAILQSSGFEVTAATYADSLGFFAALIYKWFGDKTGRLSRRSVRFYDRAIFPVSRAFDRAGLQHVLGKNLALIATRSDRP